MNYADPLRRERLDRLAAEYALGTLPRRARARLARAARAEPVVARAIDEWEQRLASLAAAVPGVTPPPRVWNRIVERLNLAEGEPTAATGGWWGRLAFWRGLAAVGFAAAFALAVALLAPRPAAPEQPVVVAVLATQDGRPAMIASAGRADRFLLVKAVGAAPVEPGKSLELWMLPEGQPPRSLGVLPSGALVRVPLAAPSEAALASIPALAVSLEPAGGSPTGLPTGPVLYSGRIERMY
jgi:anti-sigma-K factor RskA